MVEKIPVAVADEDSLVQEKEEVVVSGSASGLRNDQGGHQALLQYYCSRPPMSAVGIVVS